jgi:hypothetical protein
MSVGKLLDDIAAGADWIAECLIASGYRADFSPASLRELERFFDDAAANGAPKARGPLADDTGARLFALGAYLGEVIRRDRGGTWRADDRDPQGEINAELRLAAGDVIWPIQRVIKRFRNGREDSLVAYGAGLGLSIPEVS